MKTSSSLHHLPCLLLAGAIFLLSACASLSLDEKLTRQYHRYDQAQELVVDRYRDPARPLQQQLISRTEWEKILAPQPQEVLSVADLAELQTRQAQTVQKNRELAISSSLIDFAAWRGLPETEKNRHIREFCAAAPKGGMLHIHPWGTLTPQTFRKLLERSNPLIDAARLTRDLGDVQGARYLYPEELAWLKTLPASSPYLSLPPADRERLVSMATLPPGEHRFERFEAVFNFIALVLGGNRENLAIAYEDFAERAVRAGVSYVEFTTTLDRSELDDHQLLARLLEEKYGLTVRFNIAYFRTDTPENQNRAVRSMLQDFATPLVPGIDLLANETGRPALENGQAVYAPVLAAVRLKGAQWHRTMHAGEHGDTRDPRDAIILGAERLGHGVRLLEDPATLQYAAEKSIPVEINLSSNLKLQAVKDIRQHPYLTYLRLGLPVSLSTDDEGIFRIDINDECMLAVGQTDLTYAEFKAMAFNSIRASFAEENVKLRLLEALKASFESLEARKHEL